MFSWCIPSWLLLPQALCEIPFAPFIKSKAYAKGGNCSDNRIDYLISGGFSSGHRGSYRPLTANRFIRGPDPHTRIPKPHSGLSGRADPADAERLGLRSLREDGIHRCEAHSPS